MYRRPRISEVGVAQLRKDLRRWLARAQAGDEVVITDRGNPVARLTGVEGPTTLERLMVQGRVSQPRASRPHARAAKRVRGRGPASEYVVEDREARRH
jgi:prevent-host-death family protein